jgi:hypothetical protein
MIHRNAFPKIPDPARLWVFGASKPITGDEARKLVGIVGDFLDGWLAHGRRVVGAYEWRHDRFLLIAADEAATGVSGCSIDSLFRTLKGAERELGASLLDSGLVWYRGPDGAIVAVTRGDFRKRVSAGQVAADTLVFDNTLTTVGALRAGEWERPFQGSWHARAFAGEPARG